MTRRDAYGFTLLEAIVAMAILTSALLAMFASMSQVTRMLERAERARTADLALANALAAFEQVNVMERPKGELELGEQRVRWSSELIEPVRGGAAGSLEPGLYDLGLYQVRLEVWASGELQREVDVRRVGFRQARQPEVL